jgi:hypothetical protein
VDELVDDDVVLEPVVELEPDAELEPDVTPELEVVPEPPAPPVPGSLGASSEHAGRRRTSARATGRRRRVG